MQLFHCDTQPLIQLGILSIIDDRINHQCRHVLRMRPGKIAVFQWGCTRWHCEFIEYIVDSKTAIHETRWSIQTHEMKQREINQNAIRLAMLNRWDKVELVVQKIAECGLGSLYLFPAHRSVITEPNQKKMERLTLIAREASEQSRNRSIPAIHRSITPPLGYHHVIAQQGGVSMGERIHEQHKTPVCLRIGPEGGWDAYDVINDYTHISLGSSILRAETAAIIGGWFLANI